MKLYSEERGQCSVLMTTIPTVDLNVQANYLRLKYCAMKNQLRKEIKCRKQSLNDCGANASYEETTSTER